MANNNENIVFGIDVATSIDEAVIGEFEVVTIKDGQECGLHPRCAAHITHPCECCGRIGARGEFQYTRTIKVTKVNSRDYGEEQRRAIKEILGLDIPEDFQKKVTEHKLKYPTFDENQFWKWWMGLSKHWKSRWSKLSITELNKKRKKNKNFINWANSQK